MRVLSVEITLVYQNHQSELYIRDKHGSLARTIFCACAIRYDVPCNSKPAVLIISHNTSCFVTITASWYCRFMCNLSCKHLIQVASLPSEVKYALRASGANCIDPNIVPHDMRTMMSYALGPTVGACRWNPVVREWSGWSTVWSHVPSLYSTVLQRNAEELQTAVDNAVGLSGTFIIVLDW